jgi:two-component system chemotaxis response regulator CheB
MSSRPTHGTAAAAPVRAVVADDSPTSRALLVAVLSSCGIDVVGEAADGAGAVDLVLALGPSVVVMDVEMPTVDGIEATRRIMARRPTPIVIVTSSLRSDDVAVGLRATEVGALTVQPKPPPLDSPGFDAETQRFCRLVKAMADVKVVGRRGGRSARRSSPGRPHPTRPAQRIEVIGIGASTGGPVALQRLLNVLPADLRAPLVVVQHIPDGFAEGLVRWLSAGTAMGLAIARYVAAPGTQLTVEPERVLRLRPDPPVGGFCPSVSTLLASMAASFGPAAVGVVLTGMGVDGLEGARELHERGGLVLAQDEETSVVFGMPRAITSHGLADLVGTTDEIAEELVRLTGRRPTGAGGGRR